MMKRREITTDELARALLFGTFRGLKRKKVTIFDCKGRRTVIFWCKP